MEDNIVLICATGRSGSTTMQRILNTIPNSNICGENAGALNSLLEFYRRLKLSTSQYIPGRLRPFSYENLLSKNIKPAWYNSYNLNEMVLLIKSMIVQMFKNNPSTTLWGFKEIRYDAGNIHYIKDFKELFPQTKVIVHIRENIRSQSQSGWFRNDPKSIPFLSKTTKELIDFALANKGWCYLSSFERMFLPNHLKNMFLFLEQGEKYDEDKIKEVLQNNLKD